MINGACPYHLSDILPPIVSTRNTYNRRRPLERVISLHKTDSNSNSTDSWSLKGRRRRYKVILFHEMVNRACPYHLSDILAPIVSTGNPCNEKLSVELELESALWSEITLSRGVRLLYGFLVETIGGSISLKWNIDRDVYSHLPTKNVPLVEFIYLVFTCTPGGVTVGDSGLCCCVLCLSNAIISLCLLIFHPPSSTYFWKGS